VIYGPDGARIGDKLAPDQEGIVYADIDLAMIPVAKAAADPAGHYARRRYPAFVQLSFPRIDRHSSSDRQKMAACVCLATFRCKIREPECRGRIDALRDQSSRTGAFNSFQQEWVRDDIFSIVAMRRDADRYSRRRTNGL
jgi:hypothetical protein